MLAYALDIFFPPQCLCCDAIVPRHGALCLNCWQSVHFITEPFCACCGLPFEFTLGEGALCGECLRERPAFSRARAAFRYDDASKALIVKLKYQDQLYLASIFAAWLAKAGAELIAASDLIVPVPLHYWRFVKRRYNQSALLARVLGKHIGLAVIPDALIRTRATPPQTGLSQAERRNNVKGAFAVNPKHLSALKGKNVLLVDDVFTTGSTIEQCSKALLKAGASTVNILTLARTVR